MISKNVLFEPQYRLMDVSKDDVQQQVLNLSFQKPSTFVNIPIRHWKVALVFEL